MCFTHLSGFLVGTTKREFPGVHYYCLKTSEDCSGAFGLFEGGVIQYYRDGNSAGDRFYLWHGCPPGYTDGVAGPCSSGGVGGGGVGEVVWVMDSPSEARPWKVEANENQPGRYTVWVPSDQLNFDVPGMFMGVSFKQVDVTGFSQEALGDSTCPPGLMELVVGPESDDTNDDYQICGNTALTFFTNNCQKFTKTYEADVEALYIECPSKPRPQVIHHLSGFFSSEGRKPSQSGSIEWTCCDLVQPGAGAVGPGSEALLRLPVYDGAVSAPDGHDGDYTFSCASISNGYGKGGLMQSFKWTEHSDDATVSCYMALHMPIGQPVQLIECFDPFLNRLECSSVGNTENQQFSAFQFSRYHGKKFLSSTTYASSCEASVSIVTNHTPGHQKTEVLSLLIPEYETLTPELKQAYTTAPTMQVAMGSEILFSCRPSPSGPSHLDNVNSTLCANSVPVAAADLLRTSGVISTTGDFSLLVQDTCPVLMRPSQKIRHARVVSPKGLSMDSFFSIMKNQADLFSKGSAKFCESW